MSNTAINIYNVEEIISHLRKLGKGEILPRSNVSGICADLKTVFNADICWEVRKLIPAWPKYSGCYAFPIPAPKGHEGDESDAYIDYNKDSSSSIWQDDEYGDNRRELCLFLADCLEAEYKDSLQDE